MADQPQALTVLLVDDQAEERRLLYHALKGMYRVLEAADVASAVRWLRSERVDVVILDMNFPPHLESPRVGIRLHETIRAMAPGLPVIVATASQDRRVEERMRVRGVATFLRKPLDADKVLHAVADALPTRTS